MDQKEAIEKLYKLKNSSVVIGLTGRTGSGCSTAAKILNLASPVSLFPTVNMQGNILENKKDQLVKNWVAQNWKVFYTIHVASLIFWIHISENELENIFFELKIIDPELQMAISSKKRDFEESCKDPYQNNKNNPMFYDFVFTTIPVLYAKYLEKEGRQSATKALQKIGNKIRKDDPLKIPEIIYKTIQSLESYNLNFSIDAIRHPYEIKYLKEKIASFYVFAITTPDNNRKDRLIKKGFNMNEIKSLDAREYPSEAPIHPENQDLFFSQNIQECLNCSDVYIANPDAIEAIRFQEITRLICRYVALIQHPGLITPTSIERCMQVAFSAKVNSGCISRQVGAVITDEYLSIKAVGWNDVPKGQTPCSLRSIPQLQNSPPNDGTFSKYELSERFRSNLNYSEKFNASGRNLSFCFKSIYGKGATHTRALHAEENAFLQITKYGGQGIKEGCLFTTSSPCDLCSKKAYQLEIRKIYYIDPYPGISNDQILNAGSAIPKLILFQGAIGVAYHKLFEPIMPYKDELTELGYSVKLNSQKTTYLDDIQF